MKQDQELIAHCTSQKCQGANLRAKGVVKENVKPRTVWCPDCGSALSWLSSKSKFRAGHQWPGNPKKVV